MGIGPVGNRQIRLNPARDERSKATLEGARSSYLRTSFFCNRPGRTVDRRGFFAPGGCP